MPCLAHDEYRPRLPAANNHRKSLSCLVRETYAHCHVPCIGIPRRRLELRRRRQRGGGGRRRRRARHETGDTERDEEPGDEKRSWRCSVDSPALSGAFLWSFTPLHPASSADKCVAAEEEEKAAASDGDGDNESEAFFSVKSFFTRSTSRAATAASSTNMDPPATWEGLRDCKGWPFGLCRRPAVPPLPSTPADSWKWRKRSSNLVARPDHSPASAYTP